MRGRRAVRCACGETDPACAPPSSIPHHLWLDSCNASDFSTVRTQVAQAKNDALTSCFPHPHHPSTLRAFDARRLPLRAIPNGKALQERGGWTAGWTGVRRQPGRERPSRRPRHAECAPQGGPDPSRGCVPPSFSWTVLASRLTCACGSPAEERLRELELRSQREIAERRQELLAKEQLLRSLEARLAAAEASGGTPPPAPPAIHSPTPVSPQQQGQAHPVLTPGGQNGHDGMQ